MEPNTPTEPTPEIVTVPTREQMEKEFSEFLARPESKELREKLEVQHERRARVGIDRISDFELALLLEPKE